MQKILLAFTLLLLIALAGCVPKDRIVPERDAEATSWVEIDAATLAAKIAAGDDFILVVSSATCSSCDEFTPFLNAMIVAYGIVVYKIESGAAFPAENDVFAYEYTPTVAVIADGEVRAATDPAAHPRPFESTERLVDWLDAYVEFPLP